MTAAGARRLPDFLVIGAPKCGTIWLNHCLREHPSIHVPSSVHETMFFDRYYERGVDWYARYFADHGGAARVGEVSPTYLSADGVPERVRALVPDATLVLVARNPVDRAWSMYLHHSRKGDLREGADFWEAAEAWPEILADGSYARHLERWSEPFAPGRVHTFVLEDSFRSPQDYIGSVYSTIGVDRGFEPPSLTRRFNVHQSARSMVLSRLAHRYSRALHRAGWHRVVEAGKRLGLNRLVFASGNEAPVPKAPAALREQLRDHYLQDVRSLSSSLGRELGSVWPDFAAGGGS